jgi:hypothetical protein
MAAKKSSSKKYKQARKAAVADAKGAFTSGKTKAVRRDPLAKVSAEDKAVLSEVKKEARGNYITDDKGNKVFQKPTETAQERMLRDRREAKAAVDRMYEAEDAKTEKATKKAPAKASTPTAVEAPAETKPKVNKPGIKKKSAKKATANKPATKGYAAGKTLNATGQARYDALIKEGVAPKKAMNKALFAQEKETKSTTPKANKYKTERAAGKTPAEAAKTANPKLFKETTKSSKTSSPKVTRPTDASLTQMEDDYLKKTQEKLIKQGKLSGSKEIAIRPKGEVASTRTGAIETKVKPIPGSDTVVKKGGKLKKLGKFGVVSAALAAGFDAKNMVEGSKRKAQAEADLFYEQKGRNRNPLEKAGAAVASLPTSAKQLARYASMGLVGEDVGVAANRAEKKLAKYKQQKTAKANKGLRYGPDGSSLVPGTDAYKKGSKTRPANPVAPGAAGGATGPKGGVTPGAGGSTSSAYVVKRGDTLSGIAKNSGVKLSELLAANTKFKTNPKYKGGNMIWAGTKVKLPKK